MGIRSRFNRAKIKVQINLTFIFISILLCTTGLVLNHVIHTISDNLKASSPQQIQLSRAQNIVWLDEVLTQSMRNYAFTKDSSWFVRYNLYGAKLDSIISICKTSASNQLIKSIFDKQDIANKKLVELELRAADFIKKGQNQIALDILNSTEYIENKNIYAQTINSFFSSSETGFNDTQNKLNISIEKSSYLSKAILIGFLLFTLVIILLGITLSRSILRPIKEITQISNKIAQGDLTISISNRYQNEFGILVAAFEKMVVQLRTVVQNIRNNAENLASASSLISNSSQQIAHGANEQASTSEEVTASIEQLTASIDQNTDIALQTENISQKATYGVIEGKKASNKTVVAMGKIAEKINSVKEIANKTDILAVNASIEAARAEKFGKGFAIVASEIRKLAEKTQLLAKEIEALTDESVQIAANSENILDGIAPEVEKTSKMVQEICVASTEQNQGIKQISQAINQLTMTTQENSATAEHLASSAEELASQAETLKDTVSFFIVDSTDATSKINEMKAQMKHLAEMIEALEHTSKRQNSQTSTKFKHHKAGEVKLELDDPNFEKF